METFLSSELDFPVFVPQHNAAVPNFHFLKVAVQVQAQKPNQTHTPTALFWYEPMFKHQTSESSATKAGLKTQLTLSTLAIHPLVGTYVLQCACAFMLYCIQKYLPKIIVAVRWTHVIKAQESWLLLVLCNHQTSFTQYARDMISPQSQWEFGHQLLWDQELTHKVL